MDVRAFVIASQIPQSLFCFVYFLCCSDWLNTIALFSGLLVLFSVISTLLTLLCEFVLVIGFFSSIIFIWSFLITCVSFRNFKYFFPFVWREFVINYWNIIYMMAALKSLSDNSSIWFISALASVDYLFLHIVIVLVLDLNSDFLLYHRHFGYYIRELLILFKSSILAVTLFSFSV